MPRRVAATRTAARWVYRALTLRTPDYYATRAVLADVTAKGGTSDCYVRAAFYYDEVIVALLRAQEELPELDGATRRRIHICANNLVGRLVDLPNQAVDAMRRTLSSIMAISIVAGGNHEAISDSEVLWRNCLGAPPGTDVQRPLAFLDWMMNIPKAWQHGVDRVHESWPDPTPHELLALLELLAAAVRAQQPGRTYDCATALYNAGVSLLRARATMASPPQQLTEVRVYVNALGLVAAISGVDEAASLRKEAGQSCAVNLLGAMTDLPRSEAMQHAIRAVAGSLRGHRRELGTSLVRINRSLDELGLAGQEPSAPGSLAGSALELLRILHLEMFSVAPEWADQQAALRSLLTLVRALFLRLVEKSKLDQWCSLVADFVSKLAESDPSAFLRAHYPTKGIFQETGFLGGKGPEEQAKAYKYYEELACHPYDGAMSKRLTANTLDWVLAKETDRPEAS
jgi:hypothetical protein